MERKLSTIFASDVVGFSKMMGKNEEKTLQILGERKQVIENVISEHKGTIFGGAWLLHRLWNSWKAPKKDQSGLISDPPVQSIDEDLEKLKAKMNQKSDEC